MAVLERPDDMVKCCEAGGHDYPGDEKNTEVFIPDFFNMRLISQYEDLRSGYKQLGTSEALYNNFEIEMGVDRILLEKLLETLVTILRRSDGEMLASLVTDRLYRSCPRGKEVVMSAGGLRKFCMLYPTDLAFLSDASGRCRIRLLRTSTIKELPSPKQRGTPKASQQMAELVLEDGRADRAASLPAGHGGDQAPGLLRAAVDRLIGILRAEGGAMPAAHATLRLYRALPRAKAAVAAAGGLRRFCESFPADLAFVADPKGRCLLVARRPARGSRAAGRDAHDVSREVQGGNARRGGGAASPPAFEWPEWPPLPVSSTGSTHAATATAAAAADATASAIAAITGARPPSTPPTAKPTAKRLARGRRSAAAISKGSLQRAGEIDGGSGGLADGEPSAAAAASAADATAAAAAGDDAPRPVVVPVQEMAGGCAGALVDRKATRTLRLLAGILRSAGGGMYAARASEVGGACRKAGSRACSLSATCRRRLAPTRPTLDPD